MKKTAKHTLFARTVCAVLLCVLLAGLTGCQSGKAAGGSSSATASASSQQGLWKDAAYTADAELGSGKKTVKVEVQAEDKTITLTLHTDAKTLGDALLENKLIEGEPGDYGLYVKKVIGMQADYDKDAAYWSFSKNGEYLMSGVDLTDIADGENYEIVYTK